MATQVKKELVAELVEKIKKAQSVVFVDYQGIKVNEETSLRKQMRENGAEYLVAKNRLFKIALKESGVEDNFDEILEGTTAFAFGYNDPVAPAKAVFDLAKTKAKAKQDVFKIKGGYLTGKKVSVQEVAQQCEMSVETIRRDLNRLEKKGLLYRTHGGAVSGKINDLGSFFQIRQHVNAAAKRHIAKNALELLYENAVIGLDASSTSWYFAYLMPDIPCTVVTNSIFNVNALVNKPNIKTIVTGGVYSHKYEAFYGPLSEYLLQRLHINFSIFSCSGIDNEGNIWESNELNASLKRKMMEASEKCYLLVDQSKFEKKSLIQLSGLNKIDTIFTDSALPFPLQKYCDKVDTMTVI